MRKQKKKKDTMKKQEILFPSIVATIVLSLFFIFFPSLEAKIPQQKQARPLATLLEKRDNKDIGLDEIFDYSPLFITTRWNATKEQTPLALPTGWNFDKVKDEEYAKELRSPSFLIDENTYIKRGRSSMARAVMRSAFLGYARTDSIAPDSSTKDKISFSLVDLKSGKEIKSFSFKSSLSKNMFSIAEFNVTIENDGWTTTPLESQSSGDEKVDEELSNMLVPRSLLKGIPAGSYKAIFVP